MSELVRSAAALLPAIANHLWQSTWVALGAALLVLAFRRHHARVRAGIWLVGTLKFLVPLAALAAIERGLPWPAVRDVAPAGAVALVEAIGQPFGTVRWDASPQSTAAAAGGATVVPVVAAILWTVGSVIVLLGFLRRARHTRAVRRGAQPLPERRVADAIARVLPRRRHPRLDLVATGELISPCVIGIHRPALVWPHGLSAQLSDAQLESVLAHELCHVERRDNLAAIGVSAVQILFWFHPVVWWLGSRWRHERERACDERVVARGSDAASYADGILKVGEFCVGAMAVDHATMAGARLTERIEAIMNRDTPKTLGWTGRAALTLAMAAVAFAPVTFGARSPGAAAVGASAPASPDESRVISIQNAPANSLAGVVKDATGGTVPGATISAAPVGGGAAQARSVASAADGHFSMTGLPDGSYDVRVELAGFRTFTKRVQIDLASGAFLTVELAVGTLTETITVKAVQQEPTSSPIPEGEWQDALNRDPGNPKLYFNLARLYYQRERFVESDSLTKRAVDQMTQGLAPEPVTRATSGQAVGGNIKPPVKIRDLKPVYPSAALASNVSGVVVLEATIGRAGTVGDVRVLRSVPELDQAAASAVRQWLFTPTYLNGRPIDVTMTVTMNFFFEK